jgi:homoserine O-acetyltransferase
MDHLAKMLNIVNKDHTYNEIDSNYGHDAFLVELDKFDFLIKDMLDNG